MNKNLTKKLQEELKKRKAALEEQLATFAEKDPNLKGDWDSKFPKFEGEFGGAILETGADEVEEYGARLPVEYSFEIRLKDIDAALEKIKKGSGYGKCENCGKKIEEERLKIYPEARLCMKCHSKK